MDLNVQNILKDNYFLEDFSEHLEFGIKHGIEKLKNHEIVYIALCGSLARGNFINGWSDLDLLFITKKDGGQKLFDDRPYFNGVKIGYTVLTDNLNDDRYKDPKIWCFFRSINQGKCIEIINKDFNVPNMELDELIKVHKEYIGYKEEIQSLKDYLDSGSINNVSIKKLYMFAKILLRYNRIEVDNYGDVKLKMKEIYNLELPYPGNLLDTQTLEDSLDSCKQIVDFIQPKLY